VGREALGRATGGPAGALAAADLVLKAAEGYRAELKDELAGELEPFLDERGRPEPAYRAAIKRLEVRHHRRMRREERDYLDRVLLAASSVLRDRIVHSVGGGDDLLINADAIPEEPTSVARSAAALASIEEARAALAEELNLNQRLVLEDAFLRVGVALAA
jgi:hypothetical protein